MKYALVKELSAFYPVRRICEVMGVSSSGYYKWLNIGESAVAKRRRELDDLVRDLHRRFENKAGIRPIREILRRVHGIARTYEQIRQSFLRLELLTCGTNSGRKKTASKSIDASKSKEMPNLVNQNFTVPAPNIVWVADTTSIPVKGGWLHLAVVMDLFSRRVVGYATSTLNNAALVCAATRDAIELRDPPPGLIMHTDQGATYSSNEHRGQLAERGIVQSWSRRGECLDNAAMESWNARLKVEAFNGRPLPTRLEAEIIVLNHIERYYNCVRPHSTLNYLSPIEFEERETMKLAA